MQTLAQKYTEEFYYSKPELAKHLNYSMIDPVWSEVVQYRSFFKKDMAIVEGGRYVTLCYRTICKMDEMMGLLYQLQSQNARMKIKQDYQIMELTFETLIIDPILRGKILPLIYDAQYAYPYQFETYYKSVLTLFDEVKLPYSVFMYLMDLNQSFLLKLGVLFHYFEQKKALLCTYFYLLLVQHGLSEILHFVDFTSLFTITSGDIHAQDATYLLHRILDNFHFQIKEAMFQVQARWIESKQFEAVNKEVLVYKYPQLRLYQIEFFLNHDQIGFSYTIKQFMEYCQVSYETARYSLDELVDMGWYVKIKAGKKFIYSIN